MGIPKHKCTALCREDEGVHCIPNSWYEGKNKPEDWKLQCPSIEVLEVWREDDAFSMAVKLAKTLHGSDGWYFHEPQKGFVGYLLTVREKESPC